MKTHPSVNVLASDYGYHPSILALNQSLRPDTPTLRLTLEINWNPRDPVRSLSDLETGLLEVCPDLGRHHCRGPAQYHVHAALRNNAQNGDGREFATQDHLPFRQRAAGAIEPSLALAHLIEHAMIEAVAFLTDSEKVSGVTGAHRYSVRRFDVYVECPDHTVGLLARYVGITWILSLLRRGSFDRAESLALQGAKLLYNRRPDSLEPAHAAEVLGIEAELARDILDRLEAAGFARRAVYTLNQSGTPHFQVSASQV